MANAQTRVLVVDDELFFREAICEVLSPHGFSCRSCEDGESAVKLAASESFAVAVLDIRLPGIDGIEVLRQLRAAQPETLVIMLSASTDQELVLEALRLGACDYLAKPLHDEELTLAVRRAAEAHCAASDHRGLRRRLDDLVEEMEQLAAKVDLAGAEDRTGVICEAAVRAVARVLHAEKASLLLLDGDRSRLEVVAMVGRELELDQMESVPVGQGVAGRVLADARPLVVADIQDESQFAPDLAPDRYESNSFAVVPVGIASRQVGVLCVTDREDGRPFGTEDLALLRLISLQLTDLLAGDRATSVETPVPESPCEADRELGVGEETTGATVRFDAAGLGSEQLAGGAPPLDVTREVADAAQIFADASGVDAELARRICDAMANEIEPENVLREALRSIEAALDGDPASLYLIDSEMGDLVMESSGGRGFRLDHERLPTGRGLTGGVLQRGQLIATADPQSDPRFDPEVDTPTDQKPGPLLCVPLQLRGKTVGLCRIHLAAGATVSARTGEMLVAVLSAAVRNALLYGSLLESIEEVAEARRDARG